MLVGRRESMDREVDGRWTSVGEPPYEELLDCLELEKLPFVIHPPAA